MLKWSKVNKPELNATKKKILSISDAFNQIYIPALSIDHIPSRNGVNFKLLGVRLANYLSWDKLSLSKKLLLGTA